MKIIFVTSQLAEINVKKFTSVFYFSSFYLFICFFLMVLVLVKDNNAAQMSLTHNPLSEAIHRFSKALSGRISLSYSISCESRRVFLWKRRFVGLSEVL